MQYELVMWLRNMRQSKRSRVNVKHFLNLCSVAHNHPLFIRWKCMNIIRVVLPIFNEFSPLWWHHIFLATMFHLKLNHKMGFVMYNEIWIVKHICNTRVQVRLENLMKFMLIYISMCRKKVLAKINPLSIIWEYNLCIRGKITNWAPTKMDGKLGEQRVLIMRMKISANERYQHLLYASANLILCMMRICDEQLCEISIFSPKNPFIWPLGHIESHFFYK